MSSASLDELGLLPSGQVPSNKRVNLTGRPGTRLAVSAPPHISSKGLGQGARPSRPAGYAQRCADGTYGYGNHVGLDGLRRVVRGQDRTVCPRHLTRATPAKAGHTPATRGGGAAG